MMAFQAEPFQEVEHRAGEEHPEAEPLDAVAWTALPLAAVHQAA